MSEFDYLLDILLGGFVFPHFSETKNLINVDISIHIGFANKILQEDVFLEVEITEIVVYMLQNVLLSVFNLLDILSTFCLELAVHIDNFVEKVVRLKVFRINVKDVLTFF